MDTMNWRKSSYSGGSGAECIEVASLRSAVAVRDSKDRQGATLTLSAPAWRAFINEMKASAT
ncbi:MAG TPA: DUF397 domain-containing protein [Streptosporangiaceae bacterium]